MPSRNFAVSGLSVLITRRRYLRSNFPLLPAISSRAFLQAGFSSSITNSMRPCSFLLSWISHLSILILVNLQRGVFAYQFVDAVFKGIAKMSVIALPVHDAFNIVNDAADVLVDLQVEDLFQVVL